MLVAAVLLCAVVVVMHGLDLRKEVLVAARVGSGSGLGLGLQSGVGVGVGVGYGKTDRIVPCAGG